MPKPSTLPRWANVTGAIVEPSEDQKDIGWAIGDQVPAQWMNWLQKYTYDWIAYLNGIEGEALTWTVAQTFSHGLVAAAGSSFYGVSATTADASFSAVSAATSAAGSGIRASTSSTGHAINASTTGAGHAIVGTAGASGNGGKFLASSAQAGLVANAHASGQAGIQVFAEDHSSAYGLRATAAAGAAGIFASTATAGAAAVVSTSSSGNALEVTTSSTGSALYATTTGGGPAITGIAGANGVGGSFSASSAHPALVVDAHTAGQPGLVALSEDISGGYGIEAVGQPGAVGLYAHTSATSAAAALFSNTSGSDTAVALKTTGGSVLLADGLLNNQALGNGAICKRSTPKAWATIVTDGGGGLSITDGFNIDTGATVISGTGIDVHFKSAITTGYCCIATGPAAYGGILFGAIQNTTSRCQIEACTSSTGSSYSLSSHSVAVMLLVFGS